ncbi:MAG: ATP-binding cassette domain-containing protein [Bacillota bacterium]|nr:ATP-binding cassette domain-containing protein [Bacillota bacterium]MDW7729811.1 ATP-binding cassette domain-containing protein [Bacillota bacterium]
MDKKERTGEKQVIPWAGGKYGGQLKNNVPHGLGKLLMPDGTKYDGEWIEGKPQGRGILIYAKGAVYRGEFSEGKKHGYGQYVQPDGTIIKGRWNKGKFLDTLESLQKGSAILRNTSGRDVIRIKSLYFTYKSGKGIFDINFNVKNGEVFGFLGPNGAGKTTTIRNLLGFTKPDSGICTINGLNCWKNAAEIQGELGYLPGEMAFFDEMSGIQFFNLIGDLRGKRGNSRRDALIDRFELDPSGRIRRMSKGMKQKLGIVTAFMHDPAVYILDEPTSGLDPLMQNIFVELILEEKERGKTILMSSHNFEETYRTCDRAGIIREGRLVALEDVHSLKSSQRKAYLVTLGRKEDLEHLRSAGLEIGRISKNTVEVYVSGNYDQFISALAGCKVLGIEVATQSLEQVFLKYYGQEASF